MNNKQHASDGHPESVHEGEPYKPPVETGAAKPRQPVWRTVLMTTIILAAIGAVGFLGFGYYVMSYGFNRGANHGPIQDRPIVQP
ncbi:MAG: hypothetical protein HKN47_16720 [Pirellulaceae bacterium]|nr:hypothetical protein [Pirellulaceae bacterium]